MGGHQRGRHQCGAGVRLNRFPKNWTGDGEFRAKEGSDSGYRNSNHLIIAIIFIENQPASMLVTLLVMLIFLANNMRTVGSHPRHCR